MTTILYGHTSFSKRDGGGASHPLQVALPGDIKWTGANTSNTSERRLSPLHVPCHTASAPPTQGRTTACGVKQWASEFSYHETLEDDALQASCMVTGWGKMRAEQWQAFTVSRREASCSAPCPEDRSGDREWETGHMYSPAEPQQCTQTFLLLIGKTKR